MTHNQLFKFYVASCEKDGGIFLCEHDGQSARIVDKTTVDRPMYLAKYNMFLYAVLRQPFNDNINSGIVSYVINNSDFSLSNQSDIVSTRGNVGCHLCVSNNSVYCTNYSSGNIIRIPDNVVNHKGNSVNRKRQEMPHPHFIYNGTDDRIFVCDLGTDKIYVYDKDLNLITEASVPEGHGPRHLAFNNNYVYCVNELMSTVSVFTFSNDSLTHIQTVSALPNNYKDETTAAAIRFHDGYLYTSNRGHDSISVFKLVDNIPRQITSVSTGGKSPRDFNIIGNHLICANENSNNVTFFELTDGIPQKLQYELDIKTPLCITGV